MNEAYQRALAKIKHAQQNDVRLLDLRDMGLQTLPPNLWDLEQLEILWLNNNQLEQLPDGIGKLQQLHNLSLTHNQLSELPDAIGDLPVLNFLDVSNNQIRRFPSSLKKLHCLRTLSASRNDIRRFPTVAFRLKELEFLSLNHNQISSLRKLKPRKSGIDICLLHGNPIQDIPREIFESGNAPQLFNFIQSLQQAEAVEYLHEAKMVLVGRGYAGKTSLLRALTIPKYKLEDQIPSTEGIAIQSWDLEVQLDQPTPFRLNVWDFAGQEKYDATHQFFLTKRSLYLFVTEARQESNYLDFDYWLNIVRLRSNSSPVIVVQNKIDIRDKEVPSQLYQQQFPEIKSFVKVSCAPGFEGTIETLKMRIRESIKSLPQVGDQLPFAWVAIRHDLEADNRDFIQYREYLNICAKYGLDQQQADFLSDYYNDLGVIIHIRDHLLLKDTVFLNPDWVVDGVYKVLDARLIFMKQGRFMNRDLEAIWTETRFATKHSELLALMEHYELCFQLNRVTWLAPELLPADPPRYHAFQGPGILQFQYRYVFMPAGLLTRLIVRTHEMIDRQNCWKYGCVLKWEGARAEVIEDRINKVISIKIEGIQAKSLLAIIRRELDRLHRTFHKLEFEEMVPCNCRECILTNNPYFYRYSHLLRFIAKGRPTIDCRESAIDVPIEQLFDGTGIDRPAISTAAQTLLDKLNYLREIHSTLAEGTRKFEIGKEIERTEEELQRFRGKK